MDLSPGTRIVPVKGLPRLEVSGLGAESCDIFNVRKLDRLSKGDTSYHVDAPASSVQTARISSSRDFPALAEWQRIQPGAGLQVVWVTLSGA
jgi:hypothetical protein